MLDIARLPAMFAIELTGQNSFMLLRRLAFFGALLLWLTGINAKASQCEAHFASQGSYPSVRTYSSHVDIAGLTMSIAFYQLRIILKDSGMRVLEEDRNKGVVHAEIPAAPLFPDQPITLQFGSAAGVGRVQMINTVKSGVIVSRAQMDRQICAVLNRLTDAEGRRAGDPPAQQVSPARPPAPLAIDAADLAAQVVQARENPARIQSLFGGKSFRITGTVLQITETYRGYAVHFSGVPIQSSVDGERNAMLIVCYVPKARAQSAASLYPNQRGTLTGRFDRLENHTFLPEVALEDCAR